MKTIYTEDCLDESLWSEPLGPGWLSPDKLAALKESGDYDPDTHMEDGSIAGCSAEDQELMRQQILNHLNQLDPLLKVIVDAELKRGNRVSSAGNDYPNAGSINVTMSLRFTDQYASSEVIFSLCNDPHYWYADYSTLGNPQHLLIC